MGYSVPKPRPKQLSLADVPYSGVSHHNRRLFSDHFLDQLLPKEEAWQQLQAEATSIMESLKQRFAGFAPTDVTNEAQTERDWIMPVLQELGHTFEVQTALKVPGNKTQRPDYIFYRNEFLRLANRNTTVDEDVAQHGAFAVGDAKRWDRPLDRTLVGDSKESDEFDNKNPSFQIFFYILHSGLPWGILTNGRRWRLYHEHTAHKLEIFYEVDLPDLLASNEVEKFLYFYAFFRRAAFEPGPLALEQLLQASVDYAQQVGDNLRQQVYDALCNVAQGFLDYTENKLLPTPETCRLLYGSSLILLYRLLFILYAEARDLLPLQDNRSYKHKYSLDAIKRDAANELKDGLLIPTSGVFWQRLKTLFASIDRGNKPLGVTTFNGGLFDPRQDEFHTFLEQYAVGDLSLCQAIDKLARVNERFIDYRDLAERHLGTIYEGLLEYILHVAMEPMVELRSNSKIVPTRGIPTKDVIRTYDTGRVYLVTGRGERKTTGSYYTPDYVVKYMVEQTLGSVLDEAIAALSKTASDTEKIEAVLSVNVLDPAMGSGHFPVEAMEYIARYLVELGVQQRETSEADLTYWKRRVVQQCIYGVDLNPLAVELAKLSLWLATAAKNRPLSFLDHHLRAGNALVGSWLSEVAAGQHPGAKQAQRKAQEAEKEAGQLSLLDDEEFRQKVSDALDVMNRIEQNPGITLENVKAQEAAYEELRQRFSDKYLYLAHLGAALYYNIEVSDEVWRALANYALGKVSDYTPEVEAHFTALLEQATKLSTDGKRFFHWELEFPDIFYDHNGQPRGDKAGFDVVIGNPPYVRQEKLWEDKPFFQERYEVYHGVADLFVYFFAQGLRLLCKDGRLAYISSNSWLRANYATLLREYLRTQTTIEAIIDLGDNHIFADAPDLTPSIQLVRKGLPNGHMAYAATFARGESIKTFREQLSAKQFELSIYDQPDTGWQLTGSASRMLVAKLMEKGKPLREVIEGRMYYGVKTGLNEAFIIDQTVRDQLVKDEPACAALIKTMLRGEDLRPWYQENEGRWLICLPNGWTRDTLPELAPHEALAWEHFATRYPVLARYLEPFAEAARKRQDKGQFWWELRPCDYYDVFEQPKILWPDITRKPRFGWSEPGIYIGNTGYCIPTESYTLLGLLASRTLWYVISRISQPFGERAGTQRYRLIRQYMERLPIPVPTDTQRNSIGKLAQQITEKAQQRYEVRRKTTHRIHSDLGTPNKKPNQRLTEWWNLSFKEFRDELGKSFKLDISVKDRDDWEALLRDRSTEIKRLTEEMVSLETDLNAAVYEAFGLDKAEITLIEQETKYEYGEW